MVEPSQKKVISRLSDLAQFNGFCEIVARSKPKSNPKHKNKVLQKKFYPDLIARRASKKGRRVFEVEKTVNNNTLFKSLVSLLSYQAEMDDVHTKAYLVVPDRKLDFAGICLDQIEYLIKFFSKNNLGAFPSTRIDILGFGEVIKEYKRMGAWKDRRDRGGAGAPPKFDIF